VPKLVVDGVTTDDLNEGELGNTWFVTACASLTKEKKLFQNVSIHFFHFCLYIINLIIDSRYFRLSLVIPNWFEKRFLFIVAFYNYFIA